MTTLLEVVNESIQSACFHLRGVIVFSGCPAPNSSWQTFLNVLKDWQTLIAGVGAIIPASIAAIFVWKQVDEQRAQFLQLTERQAQKARLRLARNSSQISQMLDTFYGRLIQESFELNEHTLSEAIIEDVLDAGIMSGPTNFEFVKNYVMRTQRYASLCRLYAQSRQRDHLIEIFTELATLDAMTDALYPFARFESDVIAMPEINRTTIERQLTVNLRRDIDISKSNLSKLLKEKAFA